LYPILRPSSSSSPLGTGSSRGETSDEFGGWWGCNVVTWFWVRNCQTFAAECTGALSCRRKKITGAVQGGTNSSNAQNCGYRMYLLLTETSIFNLLWTFCLRRWFHWFDFLWADHCVRHPSLTLYPLKTVCAIQILLFDLVLHHRKHSEWVPQTL
jgi:hypothetical protein